MRQPESASVSPQEIQGSPDLMNKELEKLRPMLKSYILKMCHGDPRAQNEVDDVVQETLMKVFAHLGEFEGRKNGSLNNWALTIAKNEFLTYLRRRKSRKGDQTISIDSPVQMNGKDGSEDGKHSFENIIGGKDGAEQILINADLLEKSKIAVNEDEMFALRSYYVKGLPMGEVARHLGKSEKAVKSILHRAKKRLGKKIERLSALPEK